MKTLYLHIGTPKTGSTSLQNYLMENIEFFAKRKIYVNSGEQINNEDFSLMVWAKNDKKIHGYLQGLLADRESGSFVLSCELLYILPLCYEQLSPHWNESNHIYSSYSDRKKDYIKYLSRQLRQVFDKVIVVIYLRRQDEFLNSCYIQDVQFSLSMNIDKYCEIMEFECDYESNVEIWAANFEEENIKIVPYERESMPKGIEGSFCELLQQDYEKTKEPSQEHNPSITPEIFEFKRRFNKVIEQIDFDPCGILYRFYSYTDNILENQKSNSVKFRVLSHNMSTSILEKCKAGNDRLASRFLNQAHLFVNASPEPYEVSKTDIDSNLLFEFLSSFVFQMQLDLINQSRDLKRDLKEILKLCSTPDAKRGLSQLDSGLTDKLVKSVESLNESITLLALNNNIQLIRENNFVDGEYNSLINRAPNKESISVFIKRCLRRFRNTLFGR